MTRKNNLGNADEFYVLAKFDQRGYIAGRIRDKSNMCLS